MKPVFAPVAPQMWQWRGWTITQIELGFWLLSPASKEYGSFDSLESTVHRVERLLLMPKEK